MAEDTVLSVLKEIRTLISLKSASDDLKLLNVEEYAKVKTIKNTSKAAK